MCEGCGFSDYPNKIRGIGARAGEGALAPCPPPLFHSVLVCPLAAPVYHPLVTSHSKVSKSGSECESKLYKFFFGGGGGGGGMLPNPLSMLGS